MRTARPWAARAATGVLAGLIGPGLACRDAVGPIPTTPPAGTHDAASIVREPEDLSDKFVSRGARFDLTLGADSRVSGRVLLPPNLAVVKAGLVGTIVVPGPLNGILWIKLLLVRTEP